MAKKIEFERSYKLTDVEKLLSALATFSSGPNDSIGFWGRSRREDGSKLSFDSLSDIAPEDLNCKSFDISINHLEIGIRISVSDERFADAIRVSVEGPLDKSSECTTVLEQIATQAELEIIGEVNHTLAHGPKISLRRRLIGDIPELPTLVELYQNHLLPLAPAAECEVSMITNDRAEREEVFKDLAVLPTELPDSLAHVSFNAYSRIGGQRADLDVEYKRFPYVRIDLYINSDQEHQAIEAIEAFSKSACLEPENDSSNDGNLRGIKAIFFSKEKIDLDWFNAFANYLNELKSKRREGFHGRLEYRDSSTEETYTSLNTLVTEVQSRWDNLLVAYLDNYGSPPKITATVEPKLQLVVIEIKDFDFSSAESTLTSLAAQFALEEYPDRPYTDPNSWRSYKLSFNRGKFPNVVGDIVKSFTQSDDPVLWSKDSYIAISDDKGNKKVSRFKRLHEWIEAFQTEDEISECKITALGPRDRVVSLQTEDEMQTLHVKARLAPGAFKDLTRALKKDLSLGSKQVAESSVNSKADNWWSMFWQNKGLPGLLIGAIITSTGFITERVISKDRLELRRPHVTQGDKAAKAAEGCVTIQWAVIEQQIFDDARVLLEERGTVRVESAYSDPKIFDNFQSGKQLLLPKGRWTIDVYDNQRERASKVLEVEVKSTAQGSTIDIVEPSPCD